MANLKLKNPSGGSLALISADGASDLTATFPATTGTVMVSGNMPAFSAYQSNAQNFSSAVAAKLSLNSELFDTNNNFDSTTNYRFTPTVAGYYQFNYGFGITSFTNTGSGEVMSMLYKNGSLYVYGTNENGGSVSHYYLSTGSCLVYLNGTTDYIELYGYQETGSTRGTVANQNWNYLNGFLARAA
jgi:hypothetical protein